MTALSWTSNSEYHALQDAVERLYFVFSKYRRDPNIEHPHAYPGEFARGEHGVAHKPLRELMVPDGLYNIAVNGIVVWGRVSDYKHYLPRIFEIAAREVVDFCGFCSVVMPLVYSDWQKWPDDECAAVRCFFSAAWNHMLSDYWEGPDWDDLKDTAREQQNVPVTSIAIDLLSAIAIAEDDISPYLAKWTFSRDSALLHYLTFLDMEHAQLLAQKTVAMSLFGERPKQRKQIADWMTCFDKLLLLKEIRDKTTDRHLKRQVVQAIDFLQRSFPPLN